METNREIKLDVNPDRIEDVYEKLLEFWISVGWKLGKDLRPFSMELTKGSMLGILWGSWRLMKINLNIDEAGIIARINLFMPFTNITDYMEKKFDQEIEIMLDHLKRSLGE
jgi:hypothetical protein